MRIIFFLVTYKNSVVVDFFFLIGDCSIGAYVCTGRAAVAEQLINDHGISKVYSMRISA